MFITDCRTIFCKVNHIGCTVFFDSKQLVHSCYTTSLGLLGGQWRAFSSLFPLLSHTAYNTADFIVKPGKAIISHITKHKAMHKIDEKDCVVV